MLVKLSTCLFVSFFQAQFCFLLCSITAWHNLEEFVCWFFPSRHHPFSLSPSQLTGQFSCDTSSKRRCLAWLVKFVFPDFCLFACLSSGSKLPGAWTILSWMSGKCYHCGYYHVHKKICGKQRLRGWMRWVTGRCEFHQFCRNILYFKVSKKLSFLLS